MRALYLPLALVCLGAGVFFIDQDSQLLARAWTAVEAYSTSVPAHQLGFILLGLSTVFSVLSIHSKG